MFSYARRASFKTHLLRFPTAENIIFELKTAIPTSLEFSNSAVMRMFLPHLFVMYSFRGFIEILVRKNGNCMRIR